MSYLLMAPKWRKGFVQYGSLSFQGRGVERISNQEMSIRDLEKELLISKLELEILKKSYCCLLQNRQVRYIFIYNYRKLCTVEMMAKVLNLSVRSYYDYRNKKYVSIEMKKEYIAAHGIYGSPRLCIEFLR